MTRQVRALAELLLGFQVSDSGDGPSVFQRIAREDPGHVYRGQVAVLMRLVFVIYAEDEGLMPCSISALYERLRSDAGQYPDTLDERYGAYARLLSLFRLVFEGGEHGGLQWPARRGRLFDPDEYPFLEGRARAVGRVPDEKPAAPRVSDGCIYRVLDHLLMVDGERLSYRALDVEQLGSIYEALMGYELAASSPRMFHLRPGVERRRSGSHYTPRELTRPIVRTTLRPVLEALGERPRPEQILEVKVCDPAMGSGAFLVEACRQLAEHLVATWELHDARPRIPTGTEPLFHARRLVARHCLHGVDKNPFAVSLATLSIWLVTRAKEHTFTFLDHAFKHGDSLVGLTRKQVTAFHAWEESEAASSDARLIGDVAVAAFFGAETGKRRAELRETYRVKVRSRRARAAQWHELEEIVQELRAGENPVLPLHWEVEFPEVFERARPGFDAIVGNPPFAGHVTITTGHAAGYTEWLRGAFPGSGGKCDLVAFFFRRAFELLRPAGALGLVGTNTISQGDTRSSGLRWICTHGGRIFAVRKRVRWPGLAAVVVSVVHIQRGAGVQELRIDGRPVAAITAFLFHAGGHGDPARLAASSGLAFQGSVLRGKGFQFSDGNAAMSTVSAAARLIRADERNAQVIQPYIGGEEVNSDPTGAARRFVINFREMELEEARQWPELLAIVEKTVRPARLSSTAASSSGRVTRYWWRFGHTAKDLYRAARELRRVLVISRVGSHCAFAFQPTDRVYADSLNVVPLESYAAFCALQSRLHELWARFFGSSMKDDLRYTPSDCFQTYPFPEGWRVEPALEAAGRSYYECRAAWMTSHAEGLTKTYNRFHDPEERDPGISKLRELHGALDRAVLAAYGWSDIETDCEFLLDYGIDEETWSPRKKKPYRYRWSERAHDEVLARLLDLNRRRYAEEVAAGLHGERAVQEA